MKNFGYFPLDDDWIEDLDPSDIYIAGEDPNYPKEKIQNIPMGDTARAEVSGSVVIRFTLPTNRRVKFLAMLNHNIESGDPIIRTYDDPTWVVPSGESQAWTFREFDMKHYSRFWTPLRYWEIDLVNCSFKNTFFECGKLVCGSDIRKFSMNISPGIGRGLGFKGIHNVTEYGITYSHIIQENINYLTIRWSPSLKDKVLDELIEFVRFTYGHAYPVVLLPDNDTTEVYYMRNQDLINWEEIMTRAVIDRCIMNFKEDSRGRIQEG